VPSARDELVVCMADEPEDLFLWGATQSAAKRTVLYALYGWGAATEGIASHRGFAYQPALLAKLPSLADGDARLRDVTVLPGSPVVDPDTGSRVLYRGSPTPMPQLVVFFRLRQDVRWSDGTPVTARDSVFAFQVARDPNSGYGRRHLVDRTASYVAVDDYTVEWTGLPGYLPPTYFLNFFGPLPQHVLKNLTPSEIAISDFARRPLSYGPFAVEEWLPGHRLALSRNVFYWKARKGLPALRRLIFRFPVSPDLALSEVLNGNCDIATPDAVTPDQLPAILAAQEQGTLQVAIAPDTSWEQIAFNLQPADGRPPLGGQRALRQAIAYGFNRQAAADRVWSGQGLVKNTLVLPGHPAYPAEGLATYDYDPDRARGLLEEAGWSDANRDGIREAHGVRFVVQQTPELTRTVAITDGLPLSLTLLITVDDPLRHQVAEMFQQDMRAIGVGIRLETLPPRDLFADGPEGPLFGRRFDLAEFAWVPPPVAGPLGDLFLCDAIPSKGNAWQGNNATGYCDPAFDEAVRRARRAADQTTRVGYWRQAQGILSRALPSIPLFPYLKIVIARPDIVGLRPEASEPGALYNIDEIHRR
jgi:peptide/nickel transport system substrate-binding protein